MENTPFDWTWLYGTIGAGIGTALGYISRILFDRRKKKAEDSGAELDADTKAVELYERFASQLNPRIEAMQKRQEELFTQVSELKLENTDLKIQNRKLSAENEGLKKNMDSLHNEIETLRKQMKA